MSYSAYGAADGTEVSGSGVSSKTGSVGGGVASGSNVYSEASSGGAGHDSV